MSDTFRYLCIMNGPNKGACIFFFDLIMQLARSVRQSANSGLSKWSNLLTKVSNRLILRLGLCPFATGPSESKPSRAALTGVCRGTDISGI